MIYATFHSTYLYIIIQTLCRAGPRGSAREWATLGVHPLSWLLSNNRLEEVCGTLTKGTFSSRLLLSNQDKGCTPSVVLPYALPLGPALHNLSNMTWCMIINLCKTLYIRKTWQIMCDLSTYSRSKPGRWCRPTSCTKLQCLGKCWNVTKQLK